LVAGGRGSGDSSFAVFDIVVFVVITFVVVVVVVTFASSRG
jgi:hypothetical protein